MKRILITGSRDWDDSETIYVSLNSLREYWPNEELTVVHGGAKGADAVAGLWANSTHGVVEEVHPADWNQYGKRAGFVRNSEMVNLGADVCVAFIKDNSKGATMCADLAEKAEIPTARVIYELTKF